jgi:MFS family permease
MVKKNNKNDINAIKTIIAGFLIHTIIATFHTWQSILRYFHSYLLEYNDISIPHKRLDIYFSASNVSHGLSMIVGAYLTGFLSSLKITGIGLLIRIISESMYLFYPNIYVVEFCIVVSSIANGLIYLPVILDALRYYPNSRGFRVSIVLLGYGVNRLMFKYISIQIIDPDSVEMIHQTYRYPSIINDNFRYYLKVYLMFYAILSALSMYFLHPYKMKGKVDRDKHFEPRRKQTTDPSTIANLINIDKNFEEELNYNGRLNNKNGNEEEEDDEDEYNYIKFLLCKNRETMKKIKLFKNTKKMNNFEPFTSLVISYPFMQLTFIFFFTMLIGLVELSSIRKLGTLNGHTEDFLWRISFIFKLANAVFIPFWGKIFDIIGFKKLYLFILSVQIIISSLCFFISSSQLGFILYNGISSLLHSVNISLHITTFASIFGNVKGILLYSISWLLINIFYIARPFIGNVFVSKIYYLMFYIGLTLFTMIALIILCFLDEKKHIYTGEKKFDDSSSSSDEGNELDDLQFEDSDEKINESNSKIPSNISLKNKNQ